MKRIRIIHSTQYHYRHAALLAACQPEADTAPPQVRPVRTVTVVKRDVGEMGHVRANVLSFGHFLWCKHSACGGL